MSKLLDMWLALLHHWDLHVDGFGGHGHGHRPFNDLDVPRLWYRDELWHHLNLGAARLALLSGTDAYAADAFSRGTCPKVSR